MLFFIPSKIILVSKRGNKRRNRNFVTFFFIDFPDYIGNNSYA